MTPEEVMALLQVVGELAEDSEKFGRGADSRLTQEFYAGRAQALRSVQNLIRKRLRLHREPVLAVMAVRQEQHADPTDGDLTVDDPAVTVRFAGG